MQTLKYGHFLGPLILAAITYFIGKGNAKFSSPTKLYYTVSGTCKQVVANISAGLKMTTSAAGAACYLYTSAFGNSFRLYATGAVGGSCTKPVYCINL